MDQRLSLLTLGVKDVEKSKSFYADGLGWKVHGGQEGVIAFFQLNGFVFGLYNAEMLAKEAAGGKMGTGFGGIALAYNAPAKKDVDALLDQAVKAGATLIKAPEEVFWGGYSGYFADPDGHRWEIAFNPGWQITDDGRTLLGTD